jgi:lysine 6-dehydrogenase
VCVHLIVKIGLRWIVMRVAVIGAGLMGPTIARDCLESGDVEEVVLVDVDGSRLEEVVERLGGGSRLRAVVQDVTDRAGLVDALRGCDVAAVALLQPLNVEAIWGAVEAGVDVVDLSSPALEEYEALDAAASEAGVVVVAGCGVEPGLTEILSTYGMDNLDSVESVEIWCGGIPRDPGPPLDYKIVFGGPYLPLEPGRVKVIEDGVVGYVDRYELGEAVSFEGFDRPLEAFYDGFPETLYQIEKFGDVRRCFEQTVRYSGYCERVRFLDECGLLSREPVPFDGGEIVPFEAFSKIIYPRVRLEEGEHDVTFLRVRVRGVRDDRAASYEFNMVDRYDAERGVTSMAKTTGYTAAIVARMIGSGEVDVKGYVGAGKAVRGELFKKLLEELDERGVKINQT